MLDKSVIILLQECLKRDRVSQMGQVIKEIKNMT